MPPDPAQAHARSRVTTAETGSSVVEYVGLGAVASMLVGGVASALDSSMGERIGAVLVRRLISAISGLE